MKLQLLITQEETGSIEEVFELPSTGGIIGRSRSDVLIEDPRASRRHALLYWDGKGQLKIRDLQSRNGTFLRGRKIRDEKLFLGEEIRIGRTRVVVTRVEERRGQPLRQVDESLIERPEYDRM